MSGKSILSTADLYMCSHSNKKIQKDLSILDSSQQSGGEVGDKQKRRQSRSVRGEGER